MTAILSTGAHSSLIDGSVHSMPYSDSEAWRRQYLQAHVPESAAQWQPARSAEMGGMHNADLRMFQSNPPEYGDFDGNSTTLLAPPLSYLPESAWTPDLDMDPPSTAGFSNDALEAYSNLRMLPSNHHLPPPLTHERGRSTIQSPPSSHDGLSPHQRYLQPQRIDSRPGITRSVTAPAQGPRPAASDESAPRSLKRSGSDDEDDEYAPSEEAKPRSRKRQRIPHTAVERRYRENLNAHLDKLRQNVPSLASKRTGGGGGSNYKAEGPGDGGGVKPSKCEILNGAIEHIHALGADNEALRAEAKALRARIEDLERWYSSQGRGFAT